MSTLNPPRPPRSPLGRTRSGEPVYAERDWADYLTRDLVERVGGIDSDSLAEVAAALDALTDTVTLLASNLASLTLSVTAQGLEIDALDVRLTSAEADIDSAQAEIDGLKQGTML